MNHIFNSNLLSREPLELWHEIRVGYRLTSPMDDFRHLLMSSYHMSEYNTNIAGFNISDKVYIASEEIQLIEPLKRSHISHVTSMDRNHPFALKLAIQRMLAGKDAHSHSLVVLNMSYDPKRRPNENLFQHIDVNIYNTEEIAKKIENYLILLGDEKPSQCKNLDWYKDGGRNRRIKCELCPFKSDCSHFDTGREAIKNILDI